ncbi:MAG: 16S rRNA (uracil(1498)-N(3))-methyltransferase [Nitrospirota bacterium]|nr:16S rRNA (uracil(1498)-N(3))-methyltransferase [Nitrospirota bacterium]
MNLILLSEDDFTGQNCVQLQGRRLKHVIEVHKASVGDSLTVGLRNGPLGKGTITSLTPDAVTLELQLDQEPPAPLPVTLILALPRPKVLKRVLIAATSMGVKKIFLVNAFRVEKSFWNSPRLGKERINEFLALGLEQAKDTIMPEVLLRPLFKPFVEDELPEVMQDTLALVAHPEAKEACPRDTKKHVTLAIGPEGGFIAYEIEKLESLGFRPVTLGQRPLRIETVVPALLSKLF